MCSIVKLKGQYFKFSLARETVLEEKDELLAANTAEITQLQEELAKLKISNVIKTLVMKPSVHDVSTESQQDTESVHGGNSVPDGKKSSRQGRAPPVDSR